MPERSAVEITATCKLKGRTGVEMEALTAAGVAALTVYDMCKAVDRGMVVTDLRLLHKSGGKSGTWEAAAMISVEEALARLLAPLESVPPEQISLADGARPRARRGCRRRAAPSRPSRSRRWTATPCAPPMWRRSRPSCGSSPRSRPAPASAAQLGAGEAARIFTGAPLPDGADTIVIQEDTERDGDRVSVLEGAPLRPLRPPRPGSISPRARSCCRPAGGSPRATSAWRRR